MFQSYKNETNPELTAPRIKELRSIMAKTKLDGFFLQRADEHLNEYVAPGSERLMWLTGFSGSVAQALILKNKAAVFVDGRYTLQARQQVDSEVIEPVAIAEISPDKWLSENKIKNINIGYDPRLHSIFQIEKLREKLAEMDITLTPVKNNPIDECWQDRPEPPNEPVSVHPLKFAGRKPDTKIRELQEKLEKNQTDAIILTQPDSIAWLLNIRGRDIPHTPLPLCFAILPKSGKPELFIHPDKLGAAAKKHLEKYTVVNVPNLLEKKLATFRKEKTKIQLDANRTAQWFLDTLTHKNIEIIRKQDICTVPKAIKNEAEIEGSRAAHIRDGAAMCRFLAWLDENALSGKIDEIAAAKQLESFRSETKQLKEISFDTISGSGPNGAVIHYRVTESTNRKLKPNSLYLIDSGAQYLDGTTDITRTVAIGQPTKEMRTRFTQVLKGMIQISLARFPEGTTGAMLDTLARISLWNAGVDYAHGTGHGVGSYLSVHEGPQGISRQSHVKLQSGMILSNEPGYYKENKFGIRIENLILVSPPEAIKGGETDMHKFETLTLTPIDIRLIDPTILTDDELHWLNRYHTKVRKTLSPMLNKSEKSWLTQATKTMHKPT